MKNKFKIYGLIIILFMTGYTISYSQKNITLKECIEYSMKNNSNIKIANYDVDISDKKIQEAEGSYLPNVNMSGSYDNNLIITTTMLPGEMAQKPAGTFIPVKFGTPNNINAGIQLNQKVWDKSAIIDIQSSKVSKELSTQMLKKTNETVVYAISFAYYQAMLIGLQKEMYQTKLASTEELLKSAQLQFQNGIGKKIDVDKLQVTYNTTKSQLQQSELNYNYLVNLLKYQIGMPQEIAITLSDSVMDNFIKNPKNLENNNYNIDNYIDYQMKQTNYDLMNLNKKRSLAAFQPVVSVYGNLRVAAYRTKFDFFDTSQNWFPSSAVGVQVAYPIFTGFQRTSRVAQAELNIEKAKESITQIEQSFKVDISNYSTKFNTAYENIKNEKSNMDLAESIYKNEKLLFQQGASSSVALIQAEDSYSLAQITYLNKLFELFIARMDLEQAQGNLMNFITNLK